jgi:hypothetical protein
MLLRVFFLKPGAIWATALVVSSANACCALENPIGLSGRKVSADLADLFWFYPGINASTLAYDDGSSEFPVAVHSTDRDNRMAVKFSQFSAPVYVRGGSAYILNYVDDPGDPGTPLSPLELSLHEGNVDEPGQMIAGPVTVHASGDWSEAGEWVFAEFGYLHQSDAPLWLQVRWPSSNPFMPKLGADSGEPDLMSFYGYSNAGQDDWSIIDGCDVMLRLDMLLNTQDSAPGSDDMAADSFRIYRRDRLPVYAEDNLRVSSTTGVTLHKRVALETTHNHFCVTAWQGSVESETSVSVCIEGSSGFAAPVTIDPRDMELEVSLGENIDAFVSIRNRGTDSLCYEYSSVSPSAGDLLGIPIVILQDSGTIAPGDIDSICFQICSSSLDVGDYYEFGVILCQDETAVYSPESVSIHLSISDKTAACDSDDDPLRQDCILLQNFPNPFNSETTIVVENAGAREALSLRVVDLLGRTVDELYPQWLSRGLAVFRWDGRDAAGSPCPTGIYFCSVSAIDGSWKKMVLIR